MLRMRVRAAARVPRSEPRYARRAGETPASTICSLPRCAMRFG